VVAFSDGKPVTTFPENALKNASGPTTGAATRSDPRIDLTETPAHLRKRKDRESGLALIRPDA
jgi:hypothetical protein